MFYFDILGCELDDLAQLHATVIRARKHHKVIQGQVAVEEVFHSAMILASTARASVRSMSSGSILGLAIGSTLTSVTGAEICAMGRH